MEFEVNVDVGLYTSSWLWNVEFEVDIYVQTGVKNYVVYKLTSTLNPSFKVEN